QMRLAGAEKAASEMLLLGPGDAVANQAAALRLLVQGQRATWYDLDAALGRAEECAPPSTPARPLEAAQPRWTVEQEGPFWWAVDREGRRASAGYDSETEAQAAADAANEEEQPVIHFSLGGMPPLVPCDVAGENDEASVVPALVTCPSCQAWT